MIKIDKGVNVFIFLSLLNDYKNILKIYEQDKLV